jgi:hypothetical protein
MDDKTKYITPLLVLLAGAIASIIMYVRGYEFTRMLWVLLIVLVIFYFLGDTARYIYSRIRPRIIPEVDYGEIEKLTKGNYDANGNIMEFANDEENEQKEEVDVGVDTADASLEDEYDDEEGE